MVRYTPLILVLASSMLAGCMTGPGPGNLASAQWAPEQRIRPSKDEKYDHREGEWLGADLGQQISRDCSGLSPFRPAGQEVSFGELGGMDHILAPGDKLHIELLGDPDGLSGLYTIDSNGTVSLGTVNPVPAIGLSPRQFEADLRDSLIGQNLIRPLKGAVRVRLAETSSVPVLVSGAVFSPGIKRPGERGEQARIGQKEGEISGDANPLRSVSTALRAAGGVRPDADISSVFLIRGGRFATLDLRGMVSGFEATDPLLTTGDQIVVPEANCFNPDLVRPSSITQPGIRIFMSNLTRGANNNGGAGISDQTGSLPYGTRMSQALVAMNCIGGSYVSAHKRAVLTSRNPKNGQSIVIERDIENLMRTANRDDIDPFLMSGDALVCYDSRWTSLRDALGIIGEVAGLVTPGIIAQQAVSK